MKGALGVQARVAAWLVLGVAGALAAQAQGPAAEDPLVVATAHPRLLLRPARLRLLRRERERQSMRWRQFSALIEGGAPMPEPGFADALYYQTTGDGAAGRRAIAWALGVADLRQMALVYDWCQPLLSAAEKRTLEARMMRRMDETAPDESMPAARSRILAAVALFDEVPSLPQRQLEREIRGWWRQKIAAPLAAGRNPIPHGDAYALLELLHTVEDSLGLDLREASASFFREYPIAHLLSYYPAPYHTAENDIFIGAVGGAAGAAEAEPDLRAAALDRAAELAMVAYDTNAPEVQLVQGWLMHDRFMLRGSFGATYEFLWANPYQPGLSYYHVPLVYYNPEYGWLFARSSWDETATWLGMFDGIAQTFSGGRAMALDLRAASVPIAIDQAVICIGGVAKRFDVTLGEGQTVFVIGLEPRRRYEVEVDDEQMYEAASDPGGILALDDVPAGKPVGVRLRERTGP